MDFYCVRSRSNVNCGHLRVAQVHHRRRPHGSVRWWQEAYVSAAASVSVDIVSHRLAGLDPTAQTWSATVSALQSRQAFNSGSAALPGSYLLVRFFSKKLQANARATLNNCWLMWLVVTEQEFTGTGAVQ